MKQIIKLKYKLFDTDTKINKIPLQTKDYLLKWLKNNSDNPYPNIETKKYFSLITGLNKTEITNFLIDGRKNAKRKFIRNNKRRKR